MMVYLIADVERRWCKIGYSRYPKDRLANLQTGVPFMLEIISVIDGDARMEKKLHQKLNSYRIMGEWFNWNEEIHQTLNKYTQLPHGIQEEERKYTKITKNELAHVGNYIKTNSHPESREILIVKQIKRRIGNSIGITVSRVQRIIEILIETGQLEAIGKDVYKTSTT